MVRRSKLGLWAIVVCMVAGIGLAYFGLIESLVSPTDLPGPTAVGPIAILGVGIVGLVSSQYLDKRAWKEAGKQVGLRADGQSQFSGGPPMMARGKKPTLTGSVNGRPVRAWTYKTGQGEGVSTKTFTVVEAQLETPVEWHAAFGTPSAVDGPADHPIDSANMQSIAGMQIRGDISEDLAREILTPRVNDAVSSVEGEVAVGNITANLMNDMQEALDGDDGGMLGSLADGMLDMAGDSGEGPSRTIEHRSRGLVTDASEFQRRIQAVTTVADAVDSITASSQGE
jgi:hypothetical protein